jgi:hypothetical protein
VKSGFLLKVEYVPALPRGSADALLTWINAEYSGFAHPCMSQASVCPSQGHRYEQRTAEADDPRLFVAGPNFA